jgi:two-component system sensor histidine kinase KdpD
MSDRPTPEAMLKLAAREGRGRLKIFLGAAPGVGKTSEMLAAARRRLHEGTDVVIGVVETHDRAETAALAAGLAEIPRRLIAHKGQTLAEMDLDALLARAPALALVDEFAHSNAPGSRHPKRWQDVEELLAAGIDVWTTLNIQHVESLNDVVARITRIRVRETVPDGMIDRADEIELIDLTPDDLIQRLREGKVYVPKTAERALRHYFSPGNLTALRELALRRAAQLVDAQLLDHMQTHAISGPWAAGERVLVCVTRRAAGPALVRYARRLAERLRAPWTALYVETPRTLALAETDRARIADAMRLAEALGAESVTLPGHAVAAEVLAYARAGNFANIVIGSPAGGGLWRRLRGSITHDLIADAGDIAVHVVGTDRPDEPPAPLITQAAGPRAFLGGIAFVALATLAGLALRGIGVASGIPLVFLIAALAAGATQGLYPSLLASVIAALAYNFFFLPPLYTFTIADPENVVALGCFTLAAVVSSRLAAGLRAQALAASARARTTEQLYAFSRKLAATAELDDLLWATAYQLAAMLRRNIVLLLPLDGQIAVRAGYPPEDTLDPADLAAATWCWEHNLPAGHGADTLPGARRLFLPMRTGRGPVGVIGLDSAGATAPLLTTDQHRLLDALADQAAVSIERVQLAAESDRNRLLAETERLRSALITSISHDLRTPLAAILGAASSLEAFDTTLDPAGRTDLAATIREEAERLNRFVANLLDMTRLESGALTLRREPADLGEVIGSALARAARVLPAERVRLDIQPDLPLLPLDVVLFEQVLFNLLDNAARHAGPTSPVTVRAWRDGAGVTLQILDEGPGIPEAALQRVFERFYRASEDATARGDDRPAGTGLGLAVCRGFVEALGGHITASNRRDRPGAVFSITLPLDPP